DEAVDSAIAQTWDDLEIVIVDDGSPLPDAQEILGRQAAKDARIRVLHKTNGGLGSARNHGVEQATGEFVLFLDADNVLEPAYAETALRALANAPDAAFVTPFCRHFEDGSGRDKGVYNPVPFDVKASLLINRFGDAGAFFRRSVFTERGHRYDELLIAYEDWALWMDLAADGLEGEIVPRTLYRYRTRPDSMMEQDGLPNHPALMGLLIRGHSRLAPEAARDVLPTLFATAGQSTMRGMLGHPDHQASRPRPVEQPAGDRTRPPAPEMTGNVEPATPHRTDG